MQHDKAEQAEQRFIQEAWVHIADNLERRAVAVHTPRQIRCRTESLLVDKVAPAADALTDQETDGSHVEHGENIHLPPFCDQAADEQRADDAAVNAEAALLDVEDLKRVLQILVARVKQHVVKTRADDAADQTADDRIKQVVLVDIHFFARCKAVQNGEQKADADDDAVPVNFAIAELQRDRVDLERDAELRKLNLMGHNFCILSLAPGNQAFSSSGQMTDTAVLSSLKSD